MKQEDLIFGRWSLEGSQQDPGFIASRLRAKTGKLLKAIDKGQIDDSGKRREFTLHSFRRFVKTTVSNAGYSDYSEWLLGHNSGIRATYFKQSQKDSTDIFRRIEPNLTFLDATQIESYHADIESKIQQKDAQIAMVLNRAHEADDTIDSLVNTVKQMQEEIEKLKAERKLQKVVAE